MAVELPEVSLEDAVVASVLANEQALDALAEKSKQTGGGFEGPRFPVTLNINGTLVEVRDTSPEEKATAAQVAVTERAKREVEETKRYAKFKLDQMNEVEAVDFIRNLTYADRDIYFDAEREGQNRKAIFDVFGEKPAPATKKKENK
jgi:hypothetical protein